MERSSLPPRARKTRGTARAPRKRQWQLQDAKARFSEVFRLARSQGPQWVTRHGKEAVVVVPAEQFGRLVSRGRQPRSLVQFFAESPLARSGIDLERKADYGRAVEL